MMKQMHKINVVDNFISEEDAAILIEEMLAPSKSTEYPEYYKDRFGGTNLPYNDRVMSILVKYGKIANGIHKDLNGFINPIHVYKSFGSQWHPGMSGYPHADAQGTETFIEWSTVVYLNDDFEGGHIYFPNQGYEYKPKKFSAVFFPSAGTENVHGITEVNSGLRFTLLYMHTSLVQHADPDFLEENLHVVGFPQMTHSENHSDEKNNK